MSYSISDLEKELNQTAEYILRCIQFVVNHFYLNWILIINKSYFEGVACGIIKCFDEYSDELNFGILLLQKIPYYGYLDCLEMSMQGEDICLKFISLTCIQNLVIKLWDGGWNSKYSLIKNLKIIVSILSFGFLAPVIVFKNNQKVFAYYVFIIHVKIKYFNLRLFL